MVIEINHLLQCFAVHLFGTQFVAIHNPPVGLGLQKTTIKIVAVLIDSVVCISQFFSHTVANNCTAPDCTLCKFSYQNHSISNNPAQTINMQIQKSPTVTLRGQTFLLQRAGKTVL